MAKSMLKNMVIDEVTLCGQGANQGAKVSIFKMDGDKIDKQSFNEIMAQMGLSEKAEQMVEEFYRSNHALRESLKAILRDPQVKEKKAAMRESLSQFLSLMEGLINDTDIIKELAKPKEDQDMDVKEMEKKISDLTTQLAKAQFLASLTDVQKAHYTGLDKQGQEAFAKMSSEDREAVVQKAIAKKAADDESLTVDGDTIRKSEVGDATFRVLKKQQAQINAEAAIAKKEREAREASEFAKRAEADYSHLPGKPEEKGQILKAIEGLDDVHKAAALAMLKAGDDAIAKSMKELGAGGGGDNTASEQLEAMAKSLKDKEGITFEKAYARVLETPEGAALYPKTLS